MTERIDETLENVAESAPGSAVGFPADFWELVRAARPKAHQEIADRRQYLRRARDAQQQQQHSLPMPEGFVETSMLADKMLVDNLGNRKKSSFKNPDVPDAPDAKDLPNSKTSTVPNPVIRDNLVAKQKTADKLQKPQATVNTLKNKELATPSKISTPLPSRETVATDFQITASANLTFQYSEGILLALPILNPSLDREKVNNFSNLITNELTNTVTSISSIPLASGNLQRPRPLLDSETQPDSLDYQHYRNYQDSQACLAQDDELELAADEDYLEIVAAGETAPTDQDNSQDNSQRIEAKSNVISMKEAAYRILWQERRPMTAKEIIEKATALKMIKSLGKTPEATLATQLNQAIKIGAPPYFVKLVGRTYALNLTEEHNLPAQLAPKLAPANVYQLAEPPLNKKCFLLPSASNSRKMTYKEVAIYLLEREQRPMTTEELATLAIAEGLLTQIGKTPNVTMAGRLSDLYRSNSHPHLQRVGPNTYLINAEKSASAT
jgi:HB1, ASXL, restriction endonuclease HTH domain